MNRQALLDEMKSSVGTQAPVVYFERLTDLLGMLFDRVESLEEELHQVRTAKCTSYSMGAQGSCWYAI